MRKILAGLMATAMVTSICATASFAATSTAAKATSDSVPAAAGADLTVASIEAVVVETISGTAKTKKYTVPYSATIADTTSAVDIAKSLHGIVIPNLQIDDKRFDMKLSHNGGAAVDTVDGTLSNSVKLPNDVTVTLNFLDATGAMVELTGPADFTIDFDFDAATGNLGSGDMTADIEASGDLTKLSISDVIECDGQGNPIPLTEKAVGVDKDLNGSEGVQSNKTLYFMVKKGQYSFNNEDYWKLKVTKGDNAKIVKAISDVSKNFSSNLVNATNNSVIEETSGRNRFIKVELNELYTDTEYKVSLDMRLSAKSGANRVYGVKEESEIKVNDFTFYVKNITKTADNDWKVGINGLMLDPLGNDWNEVTYYDEDGDVAFMKFFGDSDVGKFYAKLSTKWAHEDYAAYFNDQDAFYFEFTGSPKLSSTSRADLQIYNPFVDEDGNETIDPSTATIYQVVDGDLIDVTDSFTYGEGENGDDAFLTRTRFLGSYIICEKPVEEAAGDADIDDLMPDENEVPEEVTPDNNNGGKAPANTGRYI